MPKFKPHLKTASTSSAPQKHARSGKWCLTIRQPPIPPCPASQAGEDFAAVAADMLNWTEADTDLGTVTKSALDPALADVAFATATGTPAGPVETAFGQHILVVDAITEGGAAKLDDVKAKIVDALRAENSIGILYDKVNEFEDALGSGATLAEAAAKVGGAACRNQECQPQWPRH